MKSELLGTALRAVKEAEKVILAYQSQGLKSDLKEDGSPVTAADRAAEEVIKNVILNQFPGHTFYGEEGKKVNLENHSGFTWIIDPIDGTKSYVRHNPLFATQLALMHDGEFIVGVSNAPLLKETVYAERGNGCFLNGRRIYVSYIRSVENSYLSFGALDCFKKQGNIQALLALSEKVNWARGIGDFWSYHLLAQGKLDIMIEAETKLWDIAAMKVIIEEAGGKVTQLDGKPVNPSTATLLATNGRLHAEVAKLFAGG